MKDLCGHHLGRLQVPQLQRKERCTGCGQVPPTHLQSSQNLGPSKPGATSNFSVGSGHLNLPQMQRVVFHLLLQNSRDYLLEVHEIEGKGHTFRVGECFCPLGLKLGPYTC